MLETLQLRMLQQVARLGSYSAVARELGYTQPAVTYQIRNLEKAVGTALAVRCGREMHLTDAGRELLCHAERILAAVGSAEEAMSDFVGTPRGRVRVAAFPSAYATLIAAAAAQLRSQDPGIQLDLVEADSAQAQRMVRAGEVDLAVCYRFEPVFGDSPSRESKVAEGGALSRIHLMVDRINVVLPTGHHCADAVAVGLTDLQDDIFLTASPGFRGLIDQAGADLAFVPRQATVADDYVAMQSMVANGLGVALVSDLGLAAHRNPRVVTRAMPQWPDRVIEVQLWPDLLRLEAVGKFVAALQIAVGRLQCGADKPAGRRTSRRPAAVTPVSVRTDSQPSTGRR